MVVSRRTIPGRPVMAFGDRLREGTWTVVAERTRAVREHRVLLPGRALGVVTEARCYSDGSRRVFPSKSGGEIASRVLTELPKTLNPPGYAHLVSGIGTARSG